MPREKSLEQLFKERAELDKRIRNATVKLEPVRITDWKASAIKCISDNGIFMQTIPVLECLLGDEKKLLQNKAIKRNYVSNVAVALMKLSKEDIIVKVKVPKYKGHFYGLPSWLNKDNTPKEIHMDENLKLLLKK